MTPKFPSVANIAISHMSSDHIVLLTVNIEKDF